MPVPPGRHHGGQSGAAWTCVGPGPHMSAGGRTVACGLGRDGKGRGWHLVSAAASDREAEAGRQARGTCSALLPCARWGWDEDCEGSRGC